MDEQIELGSDGTVNSKVYDVLRHNLMSGHFRPGQTMSIRFLTDKLNISATPVREAIKRLQAEHALVIGKNRTPMVPVLTRSDLRDLRDIRLTLEGMATERAASSINSEGLALIKELCNSMQQAVDDDNSEKYLEHNWHYHRAIYQTSSSQYVMRLIENLWMRSGPQVRLSFLEDASRVNSMTHHIMAFEALERGDGVAARIAIEADIAGAAAGIERAL